MAAAEFKGFAGVTLRAELMGSPEDPPVLLVHGGGQTRGMWSEVAIALVSAGRQVVSLDLRGHGESEWPADGRYDLDAFVEDLRAVLDQMASRPVVVAASLGGWIAAVALADRGVHLASGLVLVDAPPELHPESRRMGEKLRRQATREGATWDSRFLEGFDAEAAVGRVADAGARLATPVLFIRGALSEITELDSVERFVQKIPNAELAEIESVTHLMAEERADLFNGVLLDFLERKAPRAAREFRDGSDSRTLRDAMGCFATGVTIVTAMSEAGEPVGLTASSFTSVSLDPPLLLICVDKKSGSLPVLQSAPHFAINVLHIGQQPTSNRFAKRGEDKFGATVWERGESGAPIIMGSLATYECARDALHDAGDHVIFVGRVLRARFEPQRDPLLYFRGKYRRLHFT